MVPLDPKLEADFDDFEDDSSTHATGPGYDEPRATVVVVDHDLSPSQLRNLKSAAGCEVLDRSGVIIEIFSQRARSREARLQVEMARLQYLAPRLRELGGPSERQRGGIGGKGAGETSVELDRRKVRDRVARSAVSWRSSRPTAACAASAVAIRASWPLWATPTLASPR